MHRRKGHIIISAALLAVALCTGTAAGAYAQPMPATPSATADSTTVGTEAINNNDAAQPIADALPTATGESPRIAIGDTAYDTLKDALAAAKNGDVVTIGGDIALTERLTITTAKTVTVRATSDATITRTVGIHMVAMDTGGLVFEAADNATLTFEGAGAASGMAAFYTAGSATVTLGDGVDLHALNATNLSKGVIEINGGTVVFAGATMSECVGGVTVRGGGTLRVESGTVNTVTQAANGNVRIGGAGRVADRITLNGTARVTVTAALTAHTADAPLTLAASEWTVGRVVAAFPSKELAAESLSLLRAVNADGTSRRLVANGANVAIGNVDELLDRIANPFTDGLETELIDEFSTADAIADVRRQLAALSGVSDDDKAVYAAKLDAIDARRTYLEAHREQVDASVIELSRLGSMDVEQRRTQQGYQFDNMDFTGFYVRPGTNGAFRVYVEADNPADVRFTFRESGHFDTNSYQMIFVPDRFSGFSNGANDRTLANVTSSTVGYALFARNYGTGRARIRIEAADASDARPVVGTTLGRYPYYVYDANHPERFWDYVVELREYAKNVDTVTNYVGNLASDPTLDANMTGMMIGQTVLTTSARNAVTMLAGIKDEASAVAYITKAEHETSDRLAYFDHIMGFNDKDANPVHHRTRMRVVTESSENLTSPSTMFAYAYLQSLPIGATSALLDGTDPDGWGLDHEYGHTVDLGPIAIGEETNNLISLWGRVRAEKARVAKEGGEFKITTYHGDISNRALPAYQKFLAARAAGGEAAENATIDWSDVFMAVMLRWQVLRYFDEYDYAADGLEHDQSIVAQIKEYGTLGTIYRLVRENPSRYNEVGSSKRDRMVAAFSEVTGFNMAEVFGRLSVTVGDKAKEFAARYPSFDKPLEYYTTASDVQTFNGATGYDTVHLPTPTVTAKRNAKGGIDITATMKDAAAAKSTTAWRLYADGEVAGYSTDGTFSVSPGDHVPDYEVVAYDVRLNASKRVAIAKTIDLKLDVTILAGASAGDGTSGNASGKVSAKATITPKDESIKPTVVTLTNGDMTIKSVPSAVVTIDCEQCTATPDRFEIDAFDWAGETIPISIVADDVTAALGKTAKPSIAATVVDADGKPTTSGGDMAFVITAGAGEIGRDVTVYYTLDGSEPTNANGTRYSVGDAIRFTGESMTIRARAYRSGYLPSDVASASWSATRKVTVYTAIWGPSYGSGDKLELAPGTYTGAEQLGKHYENIRSVAVPAGYKVTLIGNPNTLVYTSSQNWLGNYTIDQKIHTVKVEVLSEAALPRYTVRFEPGSPAAGVTPSGTMADATLYRGVTTMLPAEAYSAPGYAFAGWKGSDGNSYADSAQVSDLAAANGTITLTAQWKAAPCDGSAACVIDPYRAAPDSKDWTAPAAPEGKAFAGWYLDKALTSAIPDEMTSGVAWPRFVDATGLFEFRGGSLRADYRNAEGGIDYTRTSLRMGYRVRPFDGTTVSAWGWRFGVGSDDLNRTLTGRNRIDGDDGSFTSNLVLTGFLTSDYRTDIHAQLWARYVTEDGTPVTLSDETRVRSVRDVAERIVSEGSGAGDDEIAYARGILAQLG